jgi:hypothetical protein
LRPTISPQKGRKFRHQELCSTPYKQEIDPWGMWSAIKKNRLSLVEKGKVACENKNKNIG